jgi:FkbM family methyltransferase
VRRLHSILRKLRRIARSELVGIDKLRYILNESNTSGAGLAMYRLRGGMNHVAPTIALRRGTTDFKVFDEIFLEQAYAPCVAALPDNLGPVTLIDLGANIGLSVLFLTRALQVIEIIAVEPDPDNFRLLLDNLLRARLANRATPLRAFAGSEHACAELHDPGNGAWGMRMGALSDTGTPVLPLAEIAGLSKIRAAKSSAPVVLKCDIEGGERQLFLHIRDWEHLIHYVFLELHTEFLSIEDLSGCLESAGFEWTIQGIPVAGARIALLMLERGVRLA